MAQIYAGTVLPNRLAYLVFSCCEFALVWHVVLIVNNCCRYLQICNACQYMYSHTSHALWMIYLPQSDLSRSASCSQLWAGACCSIFCTLKNRGQIVLYHSLYSLCTISISSEFYFFNLWVLSGSLLIIDPHSVLPLYYFLARMRSGKWVSKQRDKERKIDAHKWQRKCRARGVPNCILHA